MIRQQNSAGRLIRRPPVFATCLLHLLTALLSIGPATPARAAAAPSPSASVSVDYRLAGVMRVGTDRIGFLELPGGAQVLVRTGSTVDGGKVTALDDRQIRLTFPTRTIVLQLDRGGRPPIAEAPPSIVSSQEDNGHIMVRQVDAARMSEAIDRMELPATSPTGKPTRTRAAVQAETGQRFAALFNLPANARVVAVNEQPVVSAAKAIANVEAALAAGNPATLTLAARPGEPQGRVYLNPERD